ncbi:MAG: sulfatase [Planctomycetes bacterium]|nr:sulfatase [Planctomycetota bacterium]MCW8136720.1 sulfatase [Planctomycetota bacterium]
MPEPQSPPRPQPGLFNRRGGVWSWVGTALVIGIVSVWIYNAFYKDAKEPEPEAAPAPRHLVLISIDTLRADHLGCHDYEKARTPVIDKLAADGALFERHYSCYPLTLPAHLTQFTGVSTLGHRVRDNLYHRLPDELGTLAEAMRDEGFRTGAFVSAHTMKAGSGLERGFEVYDDADVRTLQPGHLTIPERKAPQTLKLAGDWIARQGAERFFCFVHLFDPHAPYERHEGLTEGDDTISRYDGEIAFTDKAIGEFLERLRTLDVFKDALVVITSDHGEGLGQHGELTHGYYCYDTTTHVPLILHGGGLKAGTRVPHVVRNYDLAPTLADIMQLKAESLRKQAHGVSLMQTLKDPAKDPGLSALVESHYAWLNANWAKIRGLRTRDGLALFAGDEALWLPGDQSAPANNEAAVRAARDEITRLMGAWLPPRKGSAAPREAVGGSPYPGEVPVEQNFDPESLNDTRELPSPHSQKHVLRAYQEAELDYDAQKFESCADRLRRLLADHPAFAMAHRLLAAVLQGLVTANWRELGRDKAAAYTREAAASLGASARHSARHSQTAAALAADLNRALLLAWLDDHEQLRLLARDTGDDRVAWLLLLVEYRIGEAGSIDDAIALRARLPLAGASAAAADAHLAAMQRGHAIKLAPWET